METVLLVDDEPAVRTFVRVVLEEDFIVLEASQAAEALEILSRHEGPVHLLLTDLTMPGLSGVELAQRVVHLRPQTRVLYMSGSTSDEGARRQIAQGVHPFLPKPFSPEALQTAVREALGRSGAGATS